MRRHPSFLSLVVIMIVAPFCSICGLRIGGPPPRDFQLGDLFLPEASFPEDWGVMATDPYKACSVSPLGSGCPTYGERVTYTFSDGQHFISETIFHFSDAGTATVDFDDALSTEFLSWPDEESWKPLTNPPATFTHADQQYHACRNGPLGRECGLAAQYEEFVMIFMGRHALLDDSTLQLISREIDTRMTQYMRGESVPTLDPSPSPIIQ